MTVQELIECARAQVPVTCKDVRYDRIRSIRWVFGENGEKTVQVELGYKESSGIRSSTVTVPFHVQRAES